MLSPYRVLDLCDDRGQLAGHIFAQLGADVIAVEPPDGHRSRHEGPFAGDVVDPERSLTHWAFNRGKRSIVVEDPGELDALAAGADVLIECGAIGVDLDRLTALNPALVVVSITPFGSDGPKARWLATDLTIAAAGGQMALNGDRDRAPVRMSNRQAWLNASLTRRSLRWWRCTSAIGLVVGQRADISAQQSMIVCTQFQMMYALVGPDEVVRIAGGVELGPFKIQYVHRCLDGQVTVTFLFGQMIGPFTSRLFRWMHEEGDVRRVAGDEGLDRVLRSGHRRIRARVGARSRERGDRRVRRHPHEGRVARRGLGAEPAHRPDHDHVGCPRPRPAARPRATGRKSTA